MPVDPVPIMPTRLPVKSTPSCGHCPVWYQSPLNVSSPGMAGTLAVDRQPTAVTRYFAMKVSPVLCTDMPAIGRFVVVRRRNAGPELNVAFQVELVGHEIQIAQNFRLARIAFGPFPFSHQLKGKCIPVDMTFRVASCTGVAIPEPRTPDTTGRFQYPYRQAKPITKSEQLVKACKACTNHQRVQLNWLIGSFGRSGLDITPFSLRLDNHLNAIVSNEPKWLG